MRVPLLKKRGKKTKARREQQMKLRTAIILNFPEELLSHQMRTKKKRKEERKTFDLLNQATRCNLCLIIIIKTNHRSFVG